MDDISYDPTMHLIPQFGHNNSPDKVCLMCGLGEYKCKNYVTDSSRFTPQVADKLNLVRCVDSKD